MENEKTIDALNKLIQINNDRIEGYESAAKETDEHDLKTFFNELQTTSQQCKHELSKEVISLGGTPTEATKTTGKFFRVWMDVKAALTGKDRKAILNSCEYGEDMAKDTYENIMDNDSEELTMEQESMIKDQYNLLKIDHDKVKSMRDMLVDQD
jgi:uncharacterized protein (TIGR02284 family)